MSDPAEVAAQRAWERKYGSTNSPWREGFPNQVSRGFVDAAREMAEPIREPHKPLFVEAQDATGTDAELCDVCRNERGYRVDWPCDTAKLIYSAEELAEEFNPKWQLAEGSWVIGDGPVQ